MAKNAVTDWSTTASSNTDVGGINIAEGCAAANINNALREIMAQHATSYGAIVITGGTINGTTIGASTAAAGTFTDLTATGTTTITTVDINGGAIDGTNIGAATPGTGAFSTLTGTTIDGVIGSVTPAAVTTTSLTATTADINAGTIDGTIIGGASAAAATVTDLTASGTVDLGTGTIQFDNTSIAFDAEVIADDAVTTITPPKNSGFVFIRRGGFAAQSGLIYYDTSTVRRCIENTGWAATVGSDFDTTTDTTLTGTSGTDGNTTVSANSGAIMVENRGGGSETYAFAWL